MHTKLTLLFAATLTCLTACSDKTAAPGAANAPTLADATAPKTVAAIKQEVTQAALPKADQSVPNEQYIDLHSGNQIMFQYLSLAAMPLDYKETANAYSPDFARASDEFRKNDLLTALKPKIDAEVAQAGKQRYVKMVLDRPIEKYDFEHKGFPLDGSIWESGSYRYFGDNSSYKLGFTNGDAFRYLTVASEDSARAIEGMRSKYDPLQLVVYAYTQQADITNKVVKAQIVKVALLDRKGNVLASQ
ncbi:MAG: hypothetical protein V4484_00645 [Pseudomonadota bacterium]